MDTAQAIESLLVSQPLALATDFDGTISQIAPTPDGALVHPGCRKWLGRLSDILPVVAVVSGRPADDVHRLVGLDGVVYIGNHGLERWEAGEIHIEPSASKQVEHIRRIAGVACRVLTTSGLVFEDKGTAYAVHYRLTPNPDLAREEAASVLRKLAAGTGVKVMEGRRVLELRPDLKIDKGAALFDLLSRYDLASAIYAGDDLTDVDAFAGLRRWACAGESASVAVGIRSSEMPERLSEEADLVLPGVEAWAHLLASLVQALDAERAVGPGAGSTYR
jgi:trehalose 6-phosphate phosphatase